MSLSTYANKWSPRLVVVLQLVTWSTVGIVLLQRGAVSLRGMPEDNKESGAVQPQVQDSIRDSILDAGERAEDLSISGGETEDLRIGQHNPSLIRRRKEEKEEEKRGIIGNDSTRNAESRDLVEKSWWNSVKSMREAREKGRLIEARDSKIAGSIEKNHSFDNEEKKNSSDERIMSGADANGTRIDFEQKNYIPLVAEVVEISNEKEKKSRLNPVNRAGAAAAMVMLAIGIVMLLLGPVIVILRAFDTRRQRREGRFSKSCARRDLPPSYEQATLMDQAPRYSTLRLDAIIETTSCTEQP